MSRANFLEYKRKVKITSLIFVSRRKQFPRFRLFGRKNKQLPRNSIFLPKSESFRCANFNSRPWSGWESGSHREGKLTSAGNGGRIITSGVKIKSFAVAFANENFDVRIYFPSWRILLFWPTCERCFTTLVYVNTWIFADMYFLLFERVNESESKDK